MSTPLSQRSIGHLEVFVKSAKLVEHTLVVLSNKNKYPEHLQPLINKIVEVVIEINTCIFEANELRTDGSIETKRYRRRLQNKALAKSKTLDNLILLLYKTTDSNKVKASSIDHWGMLNDEMRVKLIAWRNSDSRKQSD